MPIRCMTDVLTGPQLLLELADTTAWHSDGAAGADTEFVVLDYPPTGETMRAWADDPDDDHYEPERTRMQAAEEAAPMLFVFALVALVIAVVAFVWLDHTKAEHRAQQHLSVVGTPSAGAEPTTGPFNPPPTPETPPAQSSAPLTPVPNAQPEIPPPSWSPAPDEPVRTRTPDEKFVNDLAERGYPRGGAAIPAAKRACQLLDEGHTRFQVIEAMDANPESIANYPDWHDRNRVVITVVDTAVLDYCPQYE